MRRILLTGAAGVIGRDLAQLMPRPGEIWRLADLRPFEAAPAPGTEHLTGDLADMDFALAACDGVDSIVHLAGQPKEKPWAELIGPNLVVPAVLWEAARLKGVRRMVFGSSNHAHGMYPVDVTLTGAEPARPDSRYGATKVFGEALASLYADKAGIRAFSIRIGTYRAEPLSRRELSSWTSPRDLAALVRTGLEADYHNEIVFGVSDNLRSWVDNSRARALGYAPQDRSEDWAAKLEAGPAPEPGPATLFQGGGSASRDFAGDLDMLLRRDQRG